MTHPWIKGIRKWGILGIAAFLMGMLVLPACSPVGTAKAAQCSSGYPTGFMKTAQGKLVDNATGCEVHLTGVNWFGFETSSFSPHGLWARNWKDMLTQIKQTGFNTIRLPYSNQLFDAKSKPMGINYTLNPDLKGLQGLALMDKIVQGAHDLGLKIILDRHDTTADERPALWYTDHVPQSQWLSDWTMLAQHYRNNNTIIGADLANEPHGPATWGDGNPSTDWHMAAEKTGNAIQAVNPNWLIIVEGIEQYHGDSYWWGGNLQGAAQYPVKLSQPNKLVYSAHDYGPDIYVQQWLQAAKPADLAKTLPAVWDKQWAYLQKLGTAPVLVGEFGGRSVGQDAEGVWQRTLLTYLKNNNINYTYWSWNPDSGDTGGILKDDWKTVNQDKLKVLNAYQWPLLGQTASQSGNAAAVKNAFQWP